MSFTDTPTDGRVRRGIRTHSKIVESLLDLVSEGVEAPTAHQIATAAGVSVRTIFQHFSDLEALYDDLVKAQTVRFTPLFESLRTSGNFETRLVALGVQRRELYEAILPIRRVVQRRGIASAVVTQRLETVAAALRQQVLAQFAPELEDLGSSPGTSSASGFSSADQMIEALDLLWSFESWDRLRSTQKMDPVRAESLMVALTKALFVSGDSQP